MLAVGLAALLGCGAAGELAVEDARIVPAISGHGPAGGFLTLRNGSRKAETLVSVETEAASRVELHRSWIEDGVARMASVETLEVAPRDTVRLEPGGSHLMLFDFAPPSEGPVALRLRFADGRVRTVEAEVAAGPGPAAGGHEGHAH